jgi:uncharacterized protein (DUF1800 family)
MNSKHLKSFLMLSGALLVSVLLAFPASAEEDANPNSPTPVLLSAPDSTRALAVQETGKAVRGGLPRAGTGSFDLYSRVILYVTNVDLMKGEGASAFRLYAEDARGRHYRFPVLNMQAIDRERRIYALTVELKDEIGYWDESPTRGDVLINLTWRGLSSNRVRLGLGATGGTIKDDAGAAPTPFSSKSSLSAFSASKEEDGNSENLVGYRWSGDRIRFLEQATFGPTQALDERIRRIGLRTWLAEQFELPYPSAANPYPNFPLMRTTPPTDCNGLTDGGIPDTDPFCFANHYTMYPVQNWFYKEAFYGEAQLRHRVAWALAQLWVISGAEIDQSSHMTAYHKVLSRNAFGNWRTLMQEMTLNPGMGDYLNMRISTRLSPNENYARELMQLFNIGLFMLDSEGKAIINPNTGEPIPTYNQNVVIDFTLAFTGWSFCEIAGGQCPNRVPGSPNFIDPMIVVNPDNHDLAAKTLLSYPGSTTTNIPACSGCTGAAVTAYANNSLNQALDNIYNHPNVAPFVSKFLIQHLVTGDPTPAYVGRIAAVFNANRTSPTQLKEVVKAILLDPEARGDAKTDARYGKLREPVQFLTNIARLFDARSADRSALSDGVVTSETNAMGQIAFMAPTVFNFYPPEYLVPGTAFNGPEFALFTTGTSVARTNFGNTIVFNRININAERKVTAGTSISFADLQALAEADPSGNQLMDALNTKMMHGTMSPEMRSLIHNVVVTIPTSNPLLRAQRAVYLVATSSQYQVQR